MHQESGRDGELELEQDQPWPWAKDGAPVVLVLVGLIASGKSTFAKALEENIPQFKRCNQDDLGSRQAVERVARQALRSGLSVCIDRTNFDQTQRAHWVQIAKEIPGTTVWCLVFDTPMNVCKERLQFRTDHPTIHSFSQGEQVLYRFANMFSSPTAEEGFDRIYHLKPQAHPTPTYTENELLALLTEIASSSPPEISSVQLEIRQFLGSGNGGATRGRINASHHDASRPRGSWGNARARGRSRPSGRGVSGPDLGRYADHGRGSMARGASTASPSSAGLNSFGAGTGHGYNAFPRRSTISSSWRHDRSRSGAQESNTPRQTQGNATCSSLRSPDRQSQGTTQLGDAQASTQSDIACSGDGSAASPFTVD